MCGIRNTLDVGAVVKIAGDILTGNFTTSKGGSPSRKARPGHSAPIGTGLLFLGQTGQSK